MKQLITILSSISLLASSVLAVPTTQLAPHARPRNQVSKRVEYEANWAGAVLRSPPSGQKFTSVTGTWTVVEPVPAASGEGTWNYMQWVGLDGSTDGDMILQGGIDAFVQQSSSGSLTYQYIVWTEWYPANPVIQTAFEANAGDSITVTVTAQSTTQGTVDFVNHSTGKFHTFSLTAPSSSAALPELQAEWIVEYSGQDQFSSFSPLSFTGCSAGTNSGDSVGPGNAVTLGIENNGQDLAVGAVNGDTVTITHT